MADIHTLPGVERFDLGPDVEVARVLEQAVDHNLNTVVVIGYGPQGWYLAPSSPDMDRNIGMAMRAVHDMLHTESNEIVMGEDGA